MSELPDVEAVQQLKTALLEAIREFFEKHLDRPLAGANGPPVEARLAMAALLLQIARADFQASAEEREAAVAGVGRVLGLALEEARALVCRAESEWAQVRLPELMILVNEHSPLAQRRGLLHALWAVAYADAEIQAHEEYLVRKVAALLGLGTADLIEAKVCARERTV
jgi:uncharacterized tellurite resistance protein B-like protein